MSNQSRWLKSVPPPQSANISQSDVARIAREKRKREQQQQALDESQLAPTDSTPSVESGPPAFNAPATDSTPPAEFAAPAKRTCQPVRNEPGAKTEGAVMLPVDSPHLRTPHEITDKILPTLKPGSQIVLLRLYRLSAGFGTSRCHVSIPKLSSACNISETQVRIFLRDLETRKLIKRLSIDLTNKNQSERGITFEVLLPRLATTKSVPPVNFAPPMKNVAGTESEPNKVNTQKENTQTQDAPPATVAPGVGVGSRFTIEECRKYARHLQSTGQGINNPGGYATTIKRTGEADELIQSFLHPTAPAQSVDMTACPDCKGSGFYYPNGIGGGVAKCKHERLAKQT
jgi:hypothetical protein